MKKDRIMRAGSIVILSVLIFFIFDKSIAQTATEVYLFRLNKDNGSFQLTNPVNISNNPGRYDNQPSFLPDGSGILFSSEDSTGQTDVKLYSFHDNMIKKLTNSRGSEYSPTITPDGKFFSTIILENDGTQLLWKYPLDGGDKQLVVPELRIGYHCWYNDHLLAAFVLNEPENELHFIDLKSKENFILTENIGNSLHKIPGKKAISYIQILNDRESWIRAYYPEDGETKSIIKTLHNSYDIGWGSDVIFQGNGSVLYKYNSSTDNTWAKVADLSASSITEITRIAVNSDLSLIAIVTRE